MKRYANLYETAFSADNLLKAYQDAARHKTGKRACFEFSRNLGSNLHRLQQQLADGSYRTRPYYTFMVYEPKPRTIYAPAFADLVVQHAIYRVIYPIFNACFIEQSFACRTGYGTHQAADYAQRALQQARPDSYTLKLDIRKFFYRINRDILRCQIEKKIKDRRFVDVMMQFADHGQPVGIPIGNLLSQLYALIYLNPLDHYIKRELGVRSYCRYVDDFILFDISKQQATDYLQRIQHYLHTELQLELSKHTAAPKSKGVNFVGYRTWASRRFIRKHSLYTFTQSAKAGLLSSVVSILGHARKTWSLRHLVTTLKENHHALFNCLPSCYRRHYHPQPAPAAHRAGPERRARALHLG